MSKITDKVTELALPVVEGLGCELWDVEYLREAGEWFLRIYIDKPGGVFVDDCEAVSRALDPILDEHDPIPTAYMFEVSSPGAERKLKRKSDFERYIGSLVTLRLYKARDGKKEYAGTLAGYENGTVTLDAGGIKMSFTQEETSVVRLRLE